jgi:hypothetical protein
MLDGYGTPCRSAKRIRGQTIALFVGPSFCDIRRGTGIAR